MSLVDNDYTKCIKCHTFMIPVLHAINKEQHNITESFYTCENKDCPRYGLVSTAYDE